MLRLPSEGAVAASPETAPPKRPGLPVDPARFVAALRRRRKMLLVAFVLAAVAGVLVGKLVVAKSYQAAATVLWEPPASKQDAAREIATLADSVKLPSNLRRVRERVGSTDSPEELGKRIEVAPGDASLLLTIKTKDETREKAADLANAVVGIFLDAQLEIASARHREVAESLRASLSIAEATTVEARQRYDTFRREHGIGDLSIEIQASIESVARLRILRDEARAELEALRARESGLHQAQGRIPNEVLLATTEQRPDLARLADLETELARAKAIHADDHPTVRSLAAEADAVRARAGSDPAFVTARTLGRSAIRDALAVQAEESTILRRSIERKSTTLAQLQAEAEERTSTLGLAQGEAARRLADVEASEQHVSVLLKQLADADDDVRTVSSGFQVVSPATPPERAEKGLGRIVAVVLPLLVTLLVVVGVLIHEIAGLRLRTGLELAFWGNLPVRWTTSWPLPESDPAEGRDLSRALAASIEARFRVIGLTSFVASDGWVDFSSLVAERLIARGHTAAELVLRTPSGSPDDHLAEALESQHLREGVALLAARHDFVLVTLPPLSDREAYRVATSLVEGLIVVVASGELTGPVAADLGVALDFPHDRTMLVVTHVAPELLPRWERSVGDAALAP
jgi:uncharacterized protein involved in exopolysaccharide biosynthesis